MPTFNTGEINLYYESVGEGDCLLLLHGLGSSTRDWEYQLPDFCKYYRVLTVDTRGHGRSGKAGIPYSITQFANDIALLLDGLRVASAHVVGLSMGGMIAFQLALNHPDRVKSLVIVNSGPEVVARTLKEKFGVWQRFAILRFMGMRKMGEVLAPRLFVKEEQAATREMFIERWAENDKQAYTAALRALVGWSVLDRIHEIKVPVLVMAADEDYTPVSSKEAYVKKMPNAELLVIKDSRHATPIEHPEVFNSAVLKFLAQVNH